MASRSSRREWPLPCPGQFELPLDAGIAAPAPVAAPVAVMAAPERDEPAPPPAFGRWLARQTDASGALGLLARAIGTDPGFARRATPDELRRRLASSGADPELFDAVDDAEAAWTLAA